MNKTLINKLNREDSLDIIQNYVLEKIEVKGFKKNNVSSEMFHLFSNVLELGREIRISSQHNNPLTESKIADIFLVLVSICNSLDINLFDAFIKINN